MWRSLYVLVTTVIPTKRTNRSFGYMDSGVPKKPWIPQEGTILTASHLPAYCKVYDISGVQSVFSTLFGRGAAAMRPFAVTTAATCCLWPWPNIFVLETAG